MNATHNRYLVQGILFFLCLLPATLRGQTDTQSPYSFYGLGAITPNSLQNGMPMGGLAHGLRDSIALNFINPASYSAIDVTQLDFAFETNILRYPAASGDQQNQNLFINQLVLGIPLMNKRRFGWGMALGFSPYSQIRYSFRDTSTVILGPDTVFQSNQYKGTGGLNKLTFGTGFRVGRHVSFGFNLHYVFGISDRDRSLILPLGQDFLSSRVQEKTKVNTLMVDMGVQYFGKFKVRHRIKPVKASKDTLTDKSLWRVVEKNYHFCVGGTYNLGHSFDGDFSQLGIQMFYSGGVVSGVDTFLINPSSREDLSIPHQFGVGFTISNPDVWTVGADFNYGNWSSFRYFDQPNVNYSDAFSLHAGVEYTPPYANRYTAKNLFFRNIVYRGGVRYNSRALRPDGNPVDEMAVSFGLGLPFGFKKIYNEKGDSKSISSFINIGMEGGLARSRNGGVINETFYRLVVGVTLRDKWFVKRRYN